MEPDRERLGEVLVRMALGVPEIQVKHEALAVGLRSIVLGVRNRGFAERLPPLAAATKTVRIVDGVAGLMPQNPHAPLWIAPFHLEHLSQLQPSEPWMREIERDRHPGDPIGCKPLVRQPEM